MYIDTIEANERNGMYQLSVEKLDRRMGWFHNCLS